MNTTSRRGELAGPVLLIGFGTLVLLVNLGTIPISLWAALARLWPLALIALGLDLLIARRSVIGSILVSLLLLAVVFGGAALALPAITAAPSTVQGERIEIPSAGDPRAEVSLGPGAGSVWVDAAAAGDALIAGTIRVPNGIVDQLVETEGDTTRILLKSAAAIPIPITFGNSEVWNLSISADPELELAVNLGAGEVHLDASDLDLSRLDVRSGVGQIDVDLPAGESTVQLTTAIGQIVIQVPEGAPVSLRASTVGGAVQVPPGYTRVGSMYRSPGFTTGDHIEIDASLVFGQIRLVEQ